MVIQLDNELWFPDPRNGEEDGLIAVGGDLSIDRLLLAYSYGIFPWYAFRFYDEIQWYCPMQRFVIFPDRIHISRSMRKFINKNKYEVTFNECFENVIKKCSELHIKEDGAWLGSDMIKAYCELHDIGLATSIEVWENDVLIGGMYGVNIDYNFFGESMFSIRPNASKLAMIALADVMRKSGKGIIDCQFRTPHLESMGGEYISYDEYLKILGNKLELTERQ